MVLWGLVPLVGSWQNSSPFPSPRMAGLLGFSWGRQCGALGRAQTLESLVPGTAWTSLEKFVTGLNLSFPAGDKGDVVVRCHM